MPQVGMRVA
ncbi:hypothetical protein Nmel_009497 [Mimus melanotis]